MNHLISVIVPVYNSQPYIAACVESVLTQTWTDFELLLIDDGSGDGSTELCQTMCGRDKRIRLLRQHHKGVSVARNAGLREARGTYLFFLDSDDTIHPQLLEVLHQLLEQDGTDIATEGRLRIDNPPQNLSAGKGGQDHSWESYCLSSEEAIDYQNFGNTETCLSGIGGKLLRRDAVRNLRFDERLTHGEDTLFLYQLIAWGARVSVLKGEWYYYTMHEGGATTVFSVSTCRCRHRVNRYIRNQEIKNGRWENGLRWERIILNALERWYTISREQHDRELKTYVSQLAKAEIKSDIFSGLDIKRKINFCIMFYSYPLHQMISLLYRFFPIARRTACIGYKVLFAVYQICFVCQMLFVWVHVWKTYAGRRKRK